MAKVAHAMSRAWQRRQIPPISQPKALDSNPRRELNRSSLGQCILVDGAVLHDNYKILAGIRNEIDVFERIAVDKEQISERALFHDAELARIGIALTRQLQQFGVGPGRHGERFGGGVPTDKR